MPASAPPPGRPGAPPRRGIGGMLGLLAVLAFVILAAVILTRREPGTIAEVAPASPVVLPSTTLAPPPPLAPPSTELAVSPAVARKGYAAPSPSPSPAAASEAPPGTLAVEEAEAVPPTDASMEVSGDLADQGAMAAIPWRTAFTGNLHNKVIHFPLALGMAAAVIFVIAPRWPVYEPAARLLLIAAALAAVAAFFSGRAQEDAFEDSPFHSVVELHEKFGIASAITLWAGVALTFWARARRFLPLYGILLLLLLACTGFLGGVLSHSD